MGRHRHLIESQASITQFQEVQKLREIMETNFQAIQEEFVRRRWPEVHRWLSPYNSNLQQIDCMNAKHESPGSGQWLLSHPRFKEWYDPIYCLTPLLWLYGIPGAGKQHLLSDGSRVELVMKPDHCLNRKNDADINNHRGSSQSLQPRIDQDGIFLLQRGRPQPKFFRLCS